MVGQEPEYIWDDVSGHYRCGDGRWIQLHCNYIHHLAGTTAAFKAPVSRPGLQAILNGMTAVFGIVAAGKAWQDLTQALAGLDLATGSGDADAQPFRRLKVGITTETGQRDALTRSPGARGTPGLSW